MALGKKSILWLLGFILLGLLIRVYRINSLPMYGDELTMVYDAYSISKTGMDATGEKYPLTFRMGAGRPGGYIYFSIPFVSAFGPTILAERALSLLSGLGIIILVYFLARKLFDERVGNFAGFLAAVSPWDIYLSRGGFEAHLALFLALFGVTMFIYKKYIWWALGWGLAIHTYPTFKLTLPLMALPLFTFSGWKKVVTDKIFIISLLILMFFGGLAVREMVRSGSEERFLSQNVLSDANTREFIIQRVNYEREISVLPQALKPIFINRGIEYGRVLFENYVRNLSPDFLYLRGDGNPRHNPGEMGMLFLVEFPLLFVGFYALWSQRKKIFWLILPWILIVPLATMFLPESHGLRNAFMLPPFILLSSFAVLNIKKPVRFLVLTLIIIQLTYILVRIYTIAPAKFASFWSSEAKAASMLAIKDSESGRAVKLSTRIDNIEYAYPVYAKIEPKLVISQFGKYPKTYGKVLITDK